MVPAWMSQFGEMVVVTEQVLCMECECRGRTGTASSILGLLKLTLRLVANLYTPS